MVRNETWPRRPWAASVLTRRLPTEEWNKIAHVFEANGVALPDASSAIVATEDADRIVAFTVMQWVPHVEPMWIDQAYRGRVYWPTMIHRLEATLGTGTYYAFAPSQRIARMAQLAGLVRLPWAVYEGHIPSKE